MVARHWLLATASLLPVVLGVACPSGGCRESSNEDDSRPTKQPPTRAQDFQKCAWAALPALINLAPVSSDWFSRNGKWSGKQGAELVNWEQNRFRIDYTNLDYYVDLKPWFHAKVLRNAALELRHLRIWLPEPRNKEHRDHQPITTIVYMDCEGTPMYVSREFEKNEYEIFNHLGQLVATGHEAEMVPGQLYFKDDVGVEFAIAGSPTISQVATGTTEWLPQYHQYDFDHWQVWFMDGFNSLTYLKEPDHRWVIAAVVQEHAILQTLIHPSTGGTSTPSQYLVFTALIVATCLGALSLCCLSFGRIFQMVYPPKNAVKGNPFLVEDIGGYSSFREA